MKLFTVGPVEMYPGTLETASEQLPYFRTPEFSQLMLENERMFKASIGAHKNSKTVFLTASGSGAMEAAVINCFDSKDKVLVINGGSFGRRFADICAIHKIPYDELKLEFGEVLTEQRLDAYDGSVYTGLLVNLHETSTGQLYDIKVVSHYCQKNNIYLVVDAISAYLADEIDFDNDGIDALIVSSQKALALSPGLSIVEVSERMYRDKVMGIEPATLYFDFKDHIKNMERGQTPFTPAVGILLELHERLTTIGKQGIEDVQRAQAELAQRFRKELKELGFHTPEYPLSNALTPVLLEPNAKEIYEQLKEKYDIIVTPSGGALEKVLVRVGHLGNVKWEDYEVLLDAMKCIRESL